MAFYFLFFLIISLWKLRTLRRGQFGLEGQAGRISVADHKTLLHTKYISCGPHDFRVEEILSLSHDKFMASH